MVVIEQKPEIGVGDHVLVHSKGTFVWLCSGAFRSSYPALVNVSQPAADLNVRKIDDKTRA